MNICVIGCGYVGLVTGAIFADLGNDVIGVDIDKSRVDSLNAGDCPIHEPRLPELLKRNLEEGRLTFATSIPEAVSTSEIIFICVGTPPAEDGETDLSQVEAAATDIAHAVNGYKIIVNKSTVPVGTGDFVRDVIEKNGVAAKDFDVVCNPEFLREGQAVRDTLQPDRIVIGSSSEAAAKTVELLYQALRAPCIITDTQSAELIKYASNAFLATKITFTNAVANLCEQTQADIREVVKGVGADSRIGPAFLGAGLGYGGSCFPKDVDALLHASRRLGAEMPILEAVRAENDSRVPRFIQRIIGRLGTKNSLPLEGKTIGVLGLSFKPDTDDMREAKSIEICHALRETGARLRAYDPIATTNARRIIGGDSTEYCQNPYEAAKGASGIVIVTEWREFIQLNLNRLKSEMVEPVIFDGRNVYSSEQVTDAGFEYFSIGKTPSKPKQ
ncbi:MAG: UDP-glucose/GDP-mannose dehydrogenase family protein [Nitrospinae bacterium]|nr:UDP-glucose/GDP-mannose dehydrogenase family protein [Nitrospinota bacterium]